MKNFLLKILVFACLILLILSRRFIESDFFQNNLFAIQLNKAYGSPGLVWQEREKIYSRLLNSDTSPNNSLLSLINPKSELIALSEAIDFLQISQLNFTLGRQVIHNPNFSQAMAGWNLFRSDWITIENPSQPEKFISHFHQSSLNGHINQTLFLPANRCYLFFVEGSIERYDKVQNVWLYWETYDKGNPQGNNLFSEHGSEFWNRRFGIFCLEESMENQQKVTVAPINIYGNAEVNLSTARIYELQMK